MDKHPNDPDSEYQTLDGSPCTLHQLVHECPEWAANNIRRLEATVKAYDESLACHKLNLLALRQFQQGTHATNEDKGFYDNPRSHAEDFMLIVGEVAEALEADRLGNPPDDKIPEFSGIEAELADVVIRTLNFAEHNNMNVIGAMLAKAKFNAGRPRMHGGKRY